MLQDDHNKLAALVISHLRQNMPDFWIKFCARLRALYSKDMYWDQSKRLGYDYLAIHYHWYNRYAELVSYLIYSIYSSTILNIINRA